MTREGRYPSCSGKRRYRDHQEAVRALRRIKARSTRDRVPARAYACTVCQGYHLTARP